MQGFTALETTRLIMRASRREDGWQAFRCMAQGLDIPELRRRLLMALVGMGDTVPTPPNKVAWQRDGNRPRITDLYRPGATTYTLWAYKAIPFVYPETTATQLAWMASNDYHTSPASDGKARKVHPIFQQLKLLAQDLGGVDAGVLAGRERHHLWLSITD